MLTPDLCEHHWGPSLRAWVTQKRRSGGKPLATLCRFDHPGNGTPDLPHRKPVRLTTELTAGTSPKIKPKTSRADAFKHYANQPVWLKIMTSQAEHLPALQPFSSKNVFCAETLSCPAIAVENNVIMTSQHDSSFIAH